MNIKNISAYTNLFHSFIGRTIILFSTCWGLSWTSISIFFLTRWWTSVIISSIWIITTFTIINNPISTNWSTIITTISWTRWRRNTRASPSWFDLTITRTSIITSFVSIITIFLSWNCISITTIWDTFIFVWSKISRASSTLSRTYTL